MTEIEEYRSQTSRQATHPGAMMPSFRCACCGEYRLTAGRKPRVSGPSRYGYECRQCAEAK